MIREAIAKLVERQDLSEAEAVAVMEELMTGEATPGQVGAFLVALRLKGESVDEIAGMARVMREKATPVIVDGPLLDTCSTGGGGFDPFNVSTAAAFVCAGAGARVAKHGNRGFTSASGSAEVLEALGAKIDLAPEQVAACIETAGVGFIFAQAYHPAMRFVGPVRREIGIRTSFNILGPLTNPAGAQHQLLGVGNPLLAPKVAEALCRLGTTHALVVHGADGLDEVSLTGPTSVYDVRDGQVTNYMLTPEDAGLEPALLDDLRSGTPAENAERLKAVFDGAQGADRDFVLLNAGAALVAADKAADLREGVALARQAIDTGAARRALDAFVATSQSFEEARE
jgi:anthranilate phosphoribosyltransferase